MIIKNEIHNSKFLKSFFGKIIPMFIISMFNNFQKNWMNSFISIDSWKYYTSFFETY